MYQTGKNSSPYHKRQELSESPEQEIQGLDKYLNVPVNQHYTDKLKKQILLAEIQSVNSQLSNICKERLGDLTSYSDKNQPTWSQIQKTIKLVKNLISYIHRDSQTKKQLSTKLRKSQEEVIRQTNLSEKLAKQKRNIQKQKQTIELRLKVLQRQFKEDIQKTKKEKQDAEKKFQQIYNKENQYKNQFRKYQQTIAELQQKIKNKNIDKAQVKNKFQQIEQIKNYGPTLILSNSQNQFNNFFVNNFESNYKAIIEENQYLKSCLQSVYRELHSLLEIKKEVIRKRKGFESALESDAFQLSNIKPESFNLPKQYSQSSIQKLNQNLSKFKQALKLSDLVSSKVHDQKVHCVSQLNNLLHNYKQLVSQQGNMINKVVVTTKQRRVNQKATTQSKQGKDLQQEQLKRSKHFLEEQREILFQRNKQLEITRKAMRSTIRKAEDEKRLFDRKHLQAGEQLHVLRKNIERLPAMVEEELRMIG